MLLIPLRRSSLPSPFDVNIAKAFLNKVHNCAVQAEFYSSATMNQSWPGFWVHQTPTKSCSNCVMNYDASFDFVGHISLEKKDISLANSSSPSPSWAEQNAREFLILAFTWRSFFNWPSPISVPKRSWSSVWWTCSSRENKGGPVQANLGGLV